jgi:hypothetical protein
MEELEKIKASSWWLYIGVRDIAIAIFELGEDRLDWAIEERNYLLNRNNENLWN